MEVTSCSLIWSSDFLLLNHELWDYVLSYHCEYSKVPFYDSRLTETSWYVLTSPQSSLQRWQKHKRLSVGGSTSYKDNEGMFA